MTNTREVIKEKLTDLMYNKHLTIEDRAAIHLARTSIELWDTFIEKLADKCNGAVSRDEWEIHRKGIEVIKNELKEKIE